MKNVIIYIFLLFRHLSSNKPNQWVHYEVADNPPPPSNEISRSDLHHVTHLNPNVSDSPKEGIIKVQRKEKHACVGADRGKPVGVTGRVQKEHGSLLIGTCA